LFVISEGICFLLAPRHFRNYQTLCPQLSGETRTVILVHTGFTRLSQTGRGNLRSRWRKAQGMRRKIFEDYRVWILVFQISEKRPARQGSTPLVGQV
jgi:hypothetical protein